MSRTPLDDIGRELPCGCPGYGWDADLEADLCVCLYSERALRGFMERRPGTPVAMTLEQREWCLSQIEQVEGYDRRQYEDDSDRDLASTVLSAWTDYARDKGFRP